MRLGILEDDPVQAAFAREVLSSAGHDCRVYAEGHLLVHDLREESFDLLVLDWNVPDMPGTAVLRWVRHHLPGHMPVLFVTCHDQGTDIEAMLNAGADDYIVKPVSAGVFRARVSALLRRAYQPVPNADKAAFGEFDFDLRAKQVYRKGQRIGLTTKEFDLALLLFQHMGQLVSRKQVLETVYPRQGELPAHILETYVLMVRVKLGLNADHGYRLRAAFHYGYRLEPLTEHGGQGVA
ncbi:hypothetical protein WT83_14105 [Burkholderia territorii]|uniref:Two-component system response regulator n=1 Tax=Burkholderia territorii TaxID=1503055 RepID=A0A119VKR4_9BURK|nr:response regulator transcription factor [Burkholderia territorii]KWN16834.1 hypothetical protein WT83_14105 [Burkholderia territorii]